MEGFLKENPSLRIITPKKAKKLPNVLSKDDVDKINRLGFGAQTTKPIIPEVVNDSKQCIDGYKWSYNEDGSEKEQVPNSDDTDGKLYMDYLQIIPVLVKAIQELSAKVTALENA